MRSIRVQLAAVVLSLLSVLIAGFTLVNLDVLQSTVRTHQLDNVWLVSEAVRSSVYAAMNSNNKDHIHATMQQLGDQSSVARVRLLALDGGIISSSDPDDTAEVLPPPLHLFAEKRGPVMGPKEMLDSGRIASVFTPVMLTQECRRCHQEPAPMKAVLQVSIPEGGLEETTGRVQTILIASAFVAFLLSGVILWFATGVLITQPATELEKSMQQVEAGDLTVRLKPGTDEIGRLAVSFNTMVHELQSVKHELEESHARELERAGHLATVGELAAGVAHEIKNPLAGISGAIEVLAGDMEPADPNREILGEVLVQIRRVDKTIRDLLNFARPTEPHMVERDLNQVVVSNLGMTTRTPEQKNVNLNTHLATDLPPVKIDADQIGQLVLNLVLNSLQAASPEGEIDIRTSLGPAGNEVSLVIEDSGPGVDPDVADDIFRPFFTTKAKGTGLGLAICRRIARTHGGDLTLESATTLGGARFVLHFPLSDSPPTPNIR
jgi:signal transduction histidine kinase